MAMIFIAEFESLVQKILISTFFNIQFNILLYISFSSDRYFLQYSYFKEAD